MTSLLDDDTTGGLCLPAFHPKSIDSVYSTHVFALSSRRAVVALLGMSLRPFALLKPVGFGRSSGL